jgi:hypothetical protein
VSAYHIVDWAIEQSCTTAKHEWMLITNADNWYTPDALNFMPPGSDMIFMNFYGRYTLINELRFSNGTALENCCTRLTKQPCFYPSPRIGFIDLGAVLFNMEKFNMQGKRFTQFNGACGEYSCHDGAFVQSLVGDNGWSYTSHDLEVCAFYHNPGPQSCAMTGGGVL